MLPIASPSSLGGLRSSARRLPAEHTGGSTRSLLSPCSEPFSPSLTSSLLLLLLLLGASVLPGPHSTRPGPLSPGPAGSDTARAALLPPGARWLPLQKEPLGCPFPSNLRSPPKLLQSPELFPVSPSRLAWAGRSESGAARSSSPTQEAEYFLATRWPDQGPGAPTCREHGLLALLRPSLALNPGPETLQGATPKGAASGAPRGAGARCPASTALALTWRPSRGGGLTTDN